MSRNGKAAGAENQQHVKHVGLSTQFRLPPEFPPKQALESILPHQGDRSGTPGILEKVDQHIVQEN